jgi:CheY-like chemotaxis protein
MSGVELSRLARKIKPELSVLLTSGHSQDIFERHGRPDPDIGLLRKPYKRKDLAKAIREALPKARSAHTRQGRILVVDDQQHNRDVVERVLIDAGHIVDTATSGTEALLAVQNNPYDLVLMDLQMPVMDGDSATKAIRRLDTPARNVPIIAMTGNVQPQQVESFNTAGMNDYLGKPFKRVELLKKVNAWLRQEPPGEPQSPLPSTPEKAISKGALSDLTALMGEQWVASGLIRLRQEIESTFANEATALADQRQLARSAHALVSHCALLGFSELSRLCSALEDACRASHDVRARFRAARKVARSVLEDLSATQERSEGAIRI